MTTKPKILHILNRNNIGGITLCVYQLLSLLQNDFEVKVIAGLEDENEGSALPLAKSLNIEVEIIPEMKRSIHPVNDYKAYNKIKKIIKIYKPDIVHTHAAKAGALGRLAAKNAGVKVIVHTFHGHVFHSYFGRLKTNFYLTIERWLAQKSTKLIAISPSQKEELTNVFKIAPNNKFVTIYNGLKLDAFAQENSLLREKFRTKWGIEKNEIAIGIIGRLAPIKNIEYFIKAINELNKQENNSFKALIIGDGEERLNLENLVNKLNLNDVIVFTSWQKNMAKVYAGLDVVALCSKNEGTPTTLIEAQAAGKAIIAVNVGGVKDIVKPNETALINELDDFKTFVSNLSKVVTSQNLRYKLGENAKKYALKNFDISRHTQQTKQLYFKLLVK